MSNIIAMVNQKGGVGKTTTVVNLAAGLAELDKKVLVVDIDPQGNASSGLGIPQNEQEVNIYDVLVDGEDITNAIHHAKNDDVDVVPSNIDLAGAEVELLKKPEREFLLKKQLDNIKGDYDFILIDCPPAVNVLTINALTAAGSVIIPMQCEYYALEGLAQLTQTIWLVQKNTNPNLIIEGIVFTMYNARANLTTGVVNEVKQHYEKVVYKTTIPRNVKLSEAPSHDRSCLKYEPKCPGSIQYREFAKEFLTQHELTEASR